MKYELGERHPEHSELRRVIYQRNIPTQGVKKGDVGGFISSENNLSQKGYCVVLDDAIVRDEARVSGNAVVQDNAVVSDKAKVYGNARVSDRARVSGGAYIRDNSDVLDSVTVGGDAQIGGSARLTGNQSIDTGIIVYTKPVTLLSKIKTFFSRS